MSLTKENPKVKSIKYLVTVYDMPIFAVDMIKDIYKTEDAFLIRTLLEEVFEIKDLTIEKILELSQHDYAPITEQFSIGSKDIFKN